MLLQALALQGFGFARLWKAFEKPWETLGGFGCSIICPSPRLWEALGNSGSLWQALGRFGRLWEALQGFGMLGKALALGGMGRLWHQHGMSLTRFVNQLCLEDTRG